MTCRICLEDCTEKTTCACKAYVHPECQATWMRISKRTDCEICREPFFSYIEYTPRCASHPHGLHCGDAADNGLFAMIVLVMSVVYFTMLVFLPGWQTIFFIAIACRVFSLVWLIPLRNELYIENVWMWWQLGHCVAVCVARISTYDFPLPERMQRVRLYIMYLELTLLAIAYVFRCVVGCCRASMQRHFTTSPDMLDTTSDP